MPKHPRLQAPRSVPGILLLIAVDSGGFRGSQGGTQTKGRRGARRRQRPGRGEGGAARRLLPAPRRRRVTFSSPPRAEEPGRREAAAAAAAAAGRQVTASGGVPGGERSAGLLSPSSPSHPFSPSAPSRRRGPGDAGREGGSPQAPATHPGPRLRRRGRTREGGGHEERAAARAAGCEPRASGPVSRGPGLAFLPAASRWSVDSLPLRHLGSRSLRSPRPLPQLSRGGSGDGSVARGGRGSGSTCCPGRWPPLAT